MIDAKNIEFTSKPMACHVRHDGEFLGLLRSGVSEFRFINDIAGTLSIPRDKVVAEAANMIAEFMNRNADKIAAAWDEDEESLTV